MLVLCACVRVVWFGCLGLAVLFCGGLAGVSLWAGLRVFGLCSARCVLGFVVGACAGVLPVVFGFCCCWRWLPALCGRGLVWLLVPGRWPASCLCGLSFLLFASVCCWRSLGLGVLLVAVVVVRGCCGLGLGWCVWVGVPGLAVVWFLPLLLALSVGVGGRVSWCWCLGFVCLCGGWLLLRGVCLVRSSALFASGSWLLPLLRLRTGLFWPWERLLLCECMAECCGALCR